MDAIRQAISGGGVEIPHVPVIGQDDPWAFFIRFVADRVADVREPETGKVRRRGSARVFRAEQDFRGHQFVRREGKLEMHPVGGGVGCYRELASRLAGDRPVYGLQSPALDGTSNLTVNASVLVDAINKTIFATGSDELRPVMSGVYCELSPEHITFVATDARERLSGLHVGQAAHGLHRQPVALFGD